MRHLATVLGDFLIEMFTPRVDRSPWRGESATLLLATVSMGGCTVDFLQFFMFPKRRFWKEEQNVKCGFSSQKCMLPERRCWKAEQTPWRTKKSHFQPSVKMGRKNVDKNIDNNNKQ
jgi:hypothetical protein